MAYRNPLAQNIHESLLSFLRAPSDDRLKKCKTALQAANECALMEKSINNDSHLIDIFHLPAHICPQEVGDTAAIIGKLFSLLMDTCAKHPKAKAFLLLSTNSAGFTPLHSALISGNTANLLDYCAVVKQVVRDKVITTDEYRDLLVRGNSAGFTPLHEALISGNPAKVQAYLAVVKQALQDTVITTDDYRNLLVRGNSAGFTPLHDALISDNPANVQAYLTVVKQALQDTVITTDDYRNLLVQANSAGFSPLHQAANSGSLEVVQFFIAELEASFNQQQLYQSLNQKAKGHIPSCQVSLSKPRAFSINNYLSQKRNALARSSSVQASLWPQESHRRAERSDVQHYSAYPALFSMAPSKRRTDDDSGDERSKLRRREDDVQTSYQRQREGERQTEGRGDTQHDSAHPARFYTKLSQRRTDDSKDERQSRHGYR